MATYQRGFSSAFSRSARSTSVRWPPAIRSWWLMLLLLINMGLLFPDRISLKQYRVTELIPLPSLRPEPEPIKVVKPVVEAETASAGAGVRTAQAGRTA